MSLNCKLMAVNLVALHDFNLFKQTRLKKACFLRKNYFIGANTKTFDGFWEQPDIQLIFGDPILDDFQNFIADPINAN